METPYRIQAGSNTSEQPDDGQFPNFRVSPRDRGRLLEGRHPQSQRTDLNCKGPEGRGRGLVTSASLPPSPIPGG